MGNKICVDKKPSPIENIISFNPEILQQSEISDLSEQINKNSTSYQHLNMWCLSEIIQNNQNNSDTNSDLNKKIIEEKQKILITPVELANIHKNHFLLDSQNVYILLLIFKKGAETDIENSPFPTGFWGIIESSSNMTPRGLLFAFPAKQTSQNLESFLLSKRELNDSEFKFMLFIWNGKKSTAFLRSISLMKAFDLDKALMNNSLVHYIYAGYYFNENTKTPPTNAGVIHLGDIINNTIENSEDTSNPSTDKINNLHETVYLFKLLYPNKKHKSKNKTKKNKNELNDNKSKNNNQNILFKGFVNEFLLSGVKKNFYDNFTEVEFASSSSNNNINLNEKNYYEGFSENFTNNNNLEKSNLSNSINKNAIMPPKLNLNINLNIANKINSIGSVEDTSGSKRSLSVVTPKEDNKNNNININNNVMQNANNKSNNLKKENMNQIKIMDFGLSKIMGPKETVDDGFGTFFCSLGLYEGFFSSASKALFTLSRNSSF